MSKLPPVLQPTVLRQGIMLRHFVVLIAAVIAGGHCTTVPSEPCTAKRLGQTIVVAEKSSSCQLCKCTDDKQWICVDATKLKIECKTPNCDKSEWEPDPTSICCLRCKKEPSCRVGDVSHPCPDDPCFECACQEVLGVPMLSCSDVSSKCPKLSCPEKNTTTGQCCPQCATTARNRKTAARTAAKTTADRAAEVARTPTAKITAPTTTTTIKRSQIKTISATKSCKEKCPMLYCEATITPPGACCPVCA